MKYNELFVVNRYGKNEVYEDRDKDLKEWELYDGFKSDIILEYYGDGDGVGKVIYDSRYNNEKVLEEVNRIDKILF